MSDNSDDAGLGAAAHRVTRLQKTPPGGRPMPADTMANDLWHWQTTLVTNDIEAVTDRLRKAGVKFITPDVVVIPQGARAQLGFKKAVMVLDPSGHAIRLIEE
jgi:hypothetical protein